MDPADHIRISHLLREREAAWVRVWECEDRIRRLLHGADFPFPPPPDLPSRRRRAPLPSTPQATSPAGVRRRRPGEDAYRVTCQCRGQSCQTLTEDVEVVRTLLTAPLPTVAVLRIETVALDDDAAVTVVDNLWEAAAEGHAAPGTTSPGPDAAPALPGHVPSPRTSA